MSVLLLLVGTDFRGGVGPLSRKPVKEPRNRFPAWQAGTTTLSDVGTGPPGYIGWRNRFLGSLNVF
jgi:hypothetical protein